MEIIKAWLTAMRLRTLPLSLTGILLGSAVAQLNDYWDTMIFCFALSTTVLFQIVSNFANDLGDSQKGTDNNKRIGPKRAVQSGVISENKMKMAVILSSFLALLSAGFLIYFSKRGMTSSLVYTYVILAVLCILAAIFYTIGKKAYGYHGLGDLMVLIFFGGVSVLGVYSLYSKGFLWQNINLALFSGLLSVAVLNLNNMRDYHNDAKSGKNTLVVKMGPNSAKFYHTLLVIGGLISITLFIDKLNQPILYSSLLPGIFLILHIYKVMKTQNPREFDPELKKVALSTFAIALIFIIESFVLR